MTLLHQKSVITTLPLEKTLPKKNGMHITLNGGLASSCLCQKMKKPMKIVNGLADRLKDLIGHGDYAVGAPQSVHRQKPGQFMFDHADNPNEKDHKNNHVLTSFVCYFSDFNGGNIYYKHLGLEYHPRKGDLVIHPGTERYRHGTTPVEEGPIRYNGTLWTYDPEVLDLHAEGRVFEETDEISPLVKARMSNSKPARPKLI
jgi:hypothetical protein